MPLDRTWYNTLVDDDGSGLTGSVWDKADVNALMNAIDAQLPAWQSFNASWITSNNETTVPTQNSCRYYKTGNVLHLNLFATNMFFATAAGGLQFFFPVAPIATATIERFAVLISLGENSQTYELGMATAKDAYVGEIRRANNQQFTGFTHVSIHGQGFYLLP